MSGRSSEFTAVRAAGARARLTSEQTAEAFITMHRQRIRAKMLAKRYEVNWLVTRPGQPYAVQHRAEYRSEGLAKRRARQLRARPHVHGVEVLVSGRMWHGGIETYRTGAP